MEERVVAVQVLATAYSSGMLSHWYSAIAIIFFLGIYSKGSDALRAFPFCKELGNYKMRLSIRKIVLGQVSTAEPLRGQLISTTIGYSCLLEGLARLELERTEPINVCTGAGQVISERFEDAKRAGYKPKHFIETAVKSWYSTIGKVGITGEFGCNFAADETKYKIVCLFMKKP